MTEPEEARRLLELAERASAAGDHAEAERMLRQALKLQEASLGSVDPEVANTLNNLGVVCDILGRPREAEFLYRRALGIARKTLPPDHAYIATSLENLSGLYRAQGTPEKLADVTRERPQRSGLPGATPRSEPSADAEVEPAAEPVDAEVEPAAEPPADAEVESAPDVPARGDVQPAPATAISDFAPEPAPAVGATVAATRSGRPGLPRELPRRSWVSSRAGALLGAAAVVLFLLWLLSGDTGSSGGDSTAEGEAAVPTDQALPVPESDPASVTPGPIGGEAPSPLAPVDPPPTAPAPDAPEPLPTAPAPAELPPAALESPPVEPASPEAAEVPAVPLEVSTELSTETPWAVADARLCRRLETRSPDGGALTDWSCDAVVGIASPGQLFYYTRVRSRSAAIVEHRWLRDDQPEHRIELSIEANDGPGYRTYSARTISPRETGPWRVELRSPDGALLHVEDFVVQ